MANITDNSSMEALYSFHDGQKIGVIITALVALISFVSVFLLFVYNRPQRNTFKNPQTYTYFLCLLVSVLLQELGAVLSFGWGAMGSIGIGTLCNAQGSFKQVGELATAVWSTMLALHTFHILFLRVRATKKVFISALISGWAIVLVLSVVSPLVLQRKGSYFSVVGGSCGVASSYLLARLLTGYLFAFVAIFIAVSLSLLVLLRIRGNLSRDRYNRWQLYVVPSNDKDWKIAFSREATSTSTAMQQVTTKLVLYPIVYAALALPINIIRVLESNGTALSFAVQIVATAWYNLLGLFIVIITFYITGRPSSDSSLLPSIFSYPKSTIKKSIGSPRLLSVTRADTPASFYDKEPRSDTPASFFDKGIRADTPGSMSGVNYYDLRSATPASFYNYNREPRADTVMSFYNQDSNDDEEKPKNSSTLDISQSTVSVNLPTKPQNTYVAPESWKTTAPRGKTYVGSSA